MLGARHFRATPSLRHLLQVRRCRFSHDLGAPRTFVSSTIQRLTEEFLDLAIALPLPENLPPYSTTIIIVTVVSRLLFTVPVSVWGKSRQWRAENIVSPQLRAEFPIIRERVHESLRKDKFRGTKEEVTAEFSKRARVLAKARQKELLSLNHCSTFPTLVGTAVSQLPLFVGTSWVLSRASQYPTVFDTESFLTLTSLAHPDPTGTLPIVLGLITLANVETGRWFMSADAVKREQQVAEWSAAKRARGETVLEPRKIIQTGLRTLAVGRILIAAVIPGSVEIYWIASATFGLFQTWILDWIYSRKTMRYLQSKQALSTDTTKS